MILPQYLPPRSNANASFLPDALRNGLLPVEGKPDLDLRRSHHPPDRGRLGAVLVVHPQTRAPEGEDRRG